MPEQLENRAEILDVNGVDADHTWISGARVDSNWWTRPECSMIPIEFGIGELTVSHWPEVRRIYEEGLATGHASFETFAPTWDAWDGAHLASPRIVALQRATVVGWAALSLVSRRRVYAGVGEVSIYVDDTHRRRGVGRLLLGELVRRSEAAGLWTLQAGIFPENAASCRLHEQCGFRLVGRRERIGQHNGVWRDTVLYERRTKASIE